MDCHTVFLTEHNEEELDHVDCCARCAGAVAGATGAPSLLPIILLTRFTHLAELQKWPKDKTRLRELAGGRPRKKVFITPATRHTHYLRSEKWEFLVLSRSTYKVAAPAPARYRKSAFFFYNCYAKCDQIER
ncbi:hypothetical protein EVAR_66018_1 [Eumeta japonica]|uniref:Uncharacterized protein n=1 Tax=Eumeta variegata TaxID=151549 RepID=A0A4C1Z7J1_EUMVA|nr:hypothetical protein EVAR_66018_1 [Eumeta japonica]